MWGEFLDHEWYYRAPPGRQLPEPWRYHPVAPHCFEFDRSLIGLLAQPVRLRTISRDTERLGTLRSELLRDGLRTPLEAVADGNGHVVLRDGHHRLLASDGIPAFRAMPVFFSPSAGIRVPSHPIAGLLEAMLRSAIANRVAWRAA